MLQNGHESVGLEGPGGLCYSMDMRVLDLKGQEDYVQYGHESVGLEGPGGLCYRMDMRVLDLKGQEDYATEWT